MNKDVLCSDCPARWPDRPAEPPASVREAFERWEREFALTDGDPSPWAVWQAALASRPTSEPVDGEALARMFHEAYERLAPDFGYVTRKESRTFDPTTLNGRLMIAVCNELASRPTGEKSA